MFSESSSQKARIAAKECGQVVCPMCRGSKRVFQLDLYHQAQHSFERGEHEKPQPLSFVIACSVCAGNGWVSGSEIDSSQQDAESWHAAGVFGF